MASGKSNYLRNAILNHTIGGDVYTPPATVYVALSTLAWSASRTGTTLTASEPAGNGYARVAVTNNLTNWPTATTGSKTNGVLIAFPSATGAWGILTSFYVVDAATNGNILYGGDLYTPRTILPGDTSKFAENQLSISEA